MARQTDGSNFIVKFCWSRQFQHSYIVTQMLHTELRMFDYTAHLVHLTVSCSSMSTCVKY